MEISTVVPEEGPIDAFLIYNEQESGVDRISDALTVHGLGLHFFRRDVSPGDSFAEFEDNALRRAQAAVILLGREGWGPTHRRLATQALTLEKQVIPVLISEASPDAKADLDGLFRSRFYIDLAADFEAGIDKIVETIEKRRPWVSSTGFERLISAFVDGSNADRLEALRNIVDAPGIDRSRLAERFQRLITTEYKPEREPGFTASSRSQKDVPSIRSWLLSGLIWTDIESARSRRLILAHLSAEVEPERDVRFWCLTGLMQRRATILSDAIAVAKADPVPEISDFALLLEGNDREGLLRKLEADLLSSERERYWHVLRILRFHAVPELASTLSQRFSGLIDARQFSYDTLCAIANPDMGSACRPFLMEKPGSEAVIHAVLLQSDADPNAKQLFVNILALFDRDLVERTLLTAADDPLFGQLAIEYQGRLDRASARPAGHRSTIAGYASDTIDVTHDDLGIAEDVGTLSALVLAREVSPPLAIGLFGPWGSGKSFFLQSLQASVDRISSEGESKDFCTKIVQINFNAWHYSDANLWASLVSHILERLSAFVEPKQSLEEQAHKLAEKLHSSKSEVTEARLVKERAAEAVEQAKSELAKLKAERSALEFQLRDLRATDLKTMIEGDGDLKKSVEETMAAIGAPAAVSAVSDLNAIIAETRTLQGQVTTFVIGLLEGRSRCFVVGCIVLLAGVPFLGLALSVVVEKNFALLAAIMGEVAVAAGSAAMFLKSALKHMRTAFGKVASLKAKVEDLMATKRQEHGVDSERGLVALLSQAEAAEDAAERRLSSVTTKAVELEAKLADLQERRTLRHFLHERASSDDYRRYLGVISTIRRDFEGLVEQLQRKDEQPVERILLYIDDLDRCSHETVIEVLKAVHLILAYPLFVVVVSVDPRWLERSLKSTYFDQAGDGAYAGANPRDYLEKIFQIPFGLRPMSRDGFGRMMARLLPMSEPSGRATDQASHSSPTSTAPTIAATVKNAESSGISSAQAPMELQPSQQTGAEGRMDSGLKPPRVLAQALKMTRSEQEFAARLFPFIPTPRAAKRFTNVYRILKAPVSGQERSRFEGSDTLPGEFQVPMLLLAISIIEPGECGAIFDVISNNLDTPNSAPWTAVRDSFPQIDAMARIQPIVESSEFPQGHAILGYWLTRVRRFTFSDW